jgi:hypothetical protein
MKKTNKENPVTFFRKANEARQKNVRASIKKAQDGVSVGPQTEMESIMSNARNSQPPIPYANKPSREEMMMQRMMGESAKNVDTINNIRSAQGPQAMQARSAAVPSAERRKAYMDALTNRPKSNTPMMDSLYPKKKGGSVKRKK